MKTLKTGQAETFSNATVWVAIQSQAKVRIPEAKTIENGLAMKGVNVFAIAFMTSRLCQITVRFRNDDPLHDPDLKSQGKAVGLIKRFFPKCAWIKVIKTK